MIEQQEELITNLLEGVEQNLTKDKCLVPTIMLHSDKKVEIVDCSEAFKDDETKEALINSLCNIVQEKKVYRIIVISECWMYSASQENADQVSKMLKDGSYRDKLKRTEMYQVLDMYRNHNCSYSREFTKDDNDNIVFTGDRTVMEKVELVNFAPLQKALAQLN
jgi:hypothetical protein